MRLNLIAKLMGASLLCTGLVGCITGQEEASVALAKWQGELVNDFFFKYGKGEYQATSSQGKKSYTWESPQRVVESVGASFMVEVPSRFFPGQTELRRVTEPSTFSSYQCVLRIVTLASGRIVEIDNVKSTGECARYFSLSSAELEALEASKN